MIRDGVIFERDVIFGENLDTGYYVVVRGQVIIGDNVSIWSHTVIDPGVIIGDNVKIHCGCYISQNCVIEDNVFLGPHVTILNDKFPPRYNSSDWQPVMVREGASIGGNVTILPGVVIGERCLIGGGSVVTKDVPDGEVWAGNPARKLR